MFNIAIKKKGKGSSTQERPAYNSPISSKLTATALDKLMYQAGSYHDRQGRCVVSLNGYLNIQRLRLAIKLTLEAAPILICRFVCHPVSSYWKTPDTPDYRIPFKLVGTQDYKNEIDSFLAGPINPERDFQVDICLVRSDTDYLCVKLSHMITDAMGLLDFLQLLGKTYRELGFDLHYRPELVPDADRGQRQIFRETGLRALLRGFYYWHYPHTEWGFPVLSPDISGRSFPLRMIGKDRLENIKFYCRSKKIRFTDLLLTVFYKALIDILEPEAGAMLPVQSSIDLRRYLPSGRANTICDLAGTYYPVIRHKPGISFEQLYKVVQEAVEKARSGEPWLGGALFLELMTLVPTGIQTRYAKRIAKQEIMKGTAHPFISNLGVIDPDIFNFGEVTAIDLGMFGPVAYPPNFLLTLYTFRGNLYLNSSFCPTATDPALIDEFFERFLNYLPA